MLKAPYYKIVAQVDPTCDNLGLQFRVEYSGINVPIDSHKVHDSSLPHIKILDFSTGYTSYIDPSGSRVWLGEDNQGFSGTRFFDGYTHYLNCMTDVDVLMANLGFKRVKSNKDGEFTQTYVPISGCKFVKQCHKK